MDLQQRVTGFMRGVLDAMGLPLEVHVTEERDAVRVDLKGQGGEELLRRKGETLDALQHIVNTAFKRELTDDRRFIVDCMDYRRGKDAELRQMARFLMDKARSSGASQEMGPLNPYARRVVHLTVAEDAAMSSESIGDAFLKTVIISVRR